MTDKFGVSSASRMWSFVGPTPVICAAFRSSCAIKSQSILRGSLTELSLVGELLNFLEKIFGHVQKVSSKHPHGPCTIKNMKITKVKSSPSRRLPRRRAQVLIPTDLRGAAEGRYTCDRGIQNLGQDFLVYRVQVGSLLAPGRLARGDLELLLQLSHSLRIYRRGCLSRTTKRRRYCDISANQRHRDGS